MTEHHPVHALEESLAKARLKAIEELASKDVAISPEALRDLVAIQAALTAVRAEIAAQSEKLGWGSAAPLE